MDTKQAGYGVDTLLLLLGFGWPCMHAYIYTGPVQFQIFLQNDTVAIFVVI
jgi:hypothetical protein